MFECVGLITGLIGTGKDAGPADADMIDRVGNLATVRSNIDCVHSITGLSEIANP